MNLKGQEEAKVDVTVGTALYLKNEAGVVHEREALKLPILFFSCLPILQVLQHSLRQQGL